MRSENTSFFYLFICFQVLTVSNDPVDVISGQFDF